MGKLACPCGAILSDVAMPCHQQGYLHCQEDQWDYNFSNGRGAWECGECGRIAFDFPERSGSNVKWYTPEFFDKRHLLWDGE